MNKTLITDLDGTLIPLAGNRQNVEDLHTLSRLIRDQDVDLIFCTGRHLASVEAAIKEFSLPIPSTIIADVGTSMHQRSADGGFEPNINYHESLDRLVTGTSISQLASLLSPLGDLTRQEQEKQGQFKLSFYTHAKDIDSVVTSIEGILADSRAPYSVISSVDPFNDDGLVDVVPIGVSKAYAVRWLSEELDFENVIFAGDSGNDLAVLESGLPSILVGNAERSLADQLATTHNEKGWHGKLYLAQKYATSGVLEGCRHFGLLGTL